MFTARAKAAGFEMPRVEWLTRLERERGYDRDASPWQRIGLAGCANGVRGLRRGAGAPHTGDSRSCGAGVPLEAATRQDI